MVGESLVIKGEFINTTTNKNKWSVEKTELGGIAGSLPGIPIVADHGKSVWDIVGGFTKGVHDIKTDKVLFEGEIDNPNMIRLILKERVKFISPGAEADAFCSGCGKATKPFKTCKCEGVHDIVRNVRVKEGSIVRDPAYKTTTFEPVTFVASVNEALASQVNKVDKGSIDDTQSSSPVKTDENLGSSGEKIKEENKHMPKEKEKEKDKETKAEKEEEVKGTEKKVVGKDAIIVFAEKLEELIKKEEELVKKVDSIVTDLGAIKFPDPKSFERGPPVKGEEGKEKEKKDEPLKAEDIKALFKEAVETLMKTEKKQPEEEKGKEKEKEKTEEETKEEKEPVKGAKVDTSEDVEASSEVTAEGNLEWWKEIVAKAKECDII